MSNGAGSVAHASNSCGLHSAYRGHLQIDYHCRHRVRRVVDAQRAILARCVEPAEQARTIPLGKVLRVALIVLVQAEELQRAATLIEIDIALLRVCGEVSDARRVTETLRVD